MRIQLTDATHRIKPGKEEEFEQAEIQTMTMLKESTGMLGFQILKRTSGVWEGYTIPAEYLVMVEWESLEATQGNIPLVKVKPEILFVHGPQFLNNCLQLPTVRMAASMFRVQIYREVLNKAD